MNVLDLAKEKRSQLLGEIERLDNFLKTAVELEAIGASPNARRKPSVPVKPRPAAKRVNKAKPVTKSTAAEPKASKVEPKTASPAAAVAETQPIPDGNDLAVPDYRLHQSEFEGGSKPDVRDLKIEAKPNADQITFQYPFNSALFQKILAEHRERHGLDPASGKKEHTVESDAKQAAVV